MDIPEELNQLLEQLSASELVAHIRDLGERSAHKGMPREELKDLYLRSFFNGASEAPDPIDPLRKAVMEFIASKRGLITLPCHGDCFRHSPGQVALCYLQLGKAKDQ